MFGPPPPARHNASARAFSLSGVASATHPPAAAADSISGAARGSTTTTTLVGGHQQRSSITVTRRRPQPALLQAADPVTSQQQAQAPGGGMSDARGVVPQAAGRRRPFRFLSTFKWEARKAWDVLLDAFLSEFTAQVRPQARGLQRWGRERLSISRGPPEPTLSTMPSSCRRRTTSSS